MSYEWGITINKKLITYQLDELMCLLIQATLSSKGFDDVQLYPHLVLSPLSDRVMVSPELKKYVSIVIGILRKQVHWKL